MSDEPTFVVTFNGEEASLTAAAALAMSQDAEGDGALRIAAVLRTVAQRIVETLPRGQVG